MIEFIEKERYFDDSPFTGQCYMYPTYMVKDGKEHFVFNRREPDAKYNLKENETRKAFLTANDGKYFKFNGFYDDPFEMLKEVARRKHHFTEPGSMYYGGIERSGYLDFHGNRKEVSAAFHYRIYDAELARKIQAVAKLLNSEMWGEAIETIVAN